MGAIKQILRVKNDKLTIHLSHELNNKRVEVVILPLSDEVADMENKESGIQDLLSISVWTDEDIKQMEDASKKFNTWNFQSF